MFLRLRELAPRGQRSQEAEFTQPRDHSLAESCALLTHVEEADVLHGVDDDQSLAVAVGHQAEVGAEGEAGHVRRRHRVHVGRQAYELRVVSGHLQKTMRSFESVQPSSSIHFIKNTGGFPGGTITSLT